MSGLDMRKIMENLNTEAPKKEKLNESLGGTPMANDIMALAAKLEAVQAAAEAEELAEAEEMDETLKEDLKPSRPEVYQLMQLIEIANTRDMHDAANWIREQLIRTGVIQAPTATFSSDLLGEEND